jgi:serine protease Do
MDHKFKYKKIAQSALTIAAVLTLIFYASAFGQTKKQAATTEGFRMENAVINVADTVGKAVVSISTERTAKGGMYYFRGPGGGLPGGEDEFFQKFFEDFFGAPREREYKQTGLGSGFIVDAEGYILTNEHVISGADKITVTLSDGREFIGKVTGKDPRSDLAMVKIKADDLPTVTLGSSRDLKIGQWVVAIGNPFGFALPNPEPTVTVGVISASHRSLGRITPANKDYNNLIQTDAAINPGNSGGPLVNLKGEVIGINVAIISLTGGYQGLGFAIPIDSVKRVMNALKEGKTIIYGWLGVGAQEVNEELRKHFGLEEKKGALVSNVIEDSPAAKAGIRPGDIIVEIDNKPIENVAQLLDVVGDLEAGKTVNVRVIRDKQSMVIETMIGRRPQDLEGEGEEGEKELSWRGLMVEDVDSEIARQFDITEEDGVLVLDVEPGSAADAAGLRPGDIIISINDEEITGMDDFNKATKGIEGGSSVLVRTTRGYFVIKE